MTKVDSKEKVIALTKMRSAAAALFFNETGEVLLIKPLDKDGWSIPGGAGEKFETLSETAEREVKEEIGLTKSLKRLLAIDCIKRKVDDFPDEVVLALFYGGVLKKREIEKIVLQKEEIEKMIFVPIKSVGKYLRKKSRMSKMIKFVLKQKSLEKVYYFENEKIFQ